MFESTTFIPLSPCLNVSRIVVYSLARFHHLVHCIFGLLNRNRVASKGGPPWTPPPLYLYPFFVIGM